MNKGYIEGEMVWSIFPAHGSHMGDMDSFPGRFPGVCMEVNNDG